jgi:uncharacterized membrane protein
MNRHKCSFLDKLTRVIAWFIGSWLGVLAHVIWFSTWIVLDLPIEHLTFLVSLEAIFIGIFLLMAANQEEKDRLLREAREKAREMQHMKEDLELDRKEAEELKEIKEGFASLKSDLEAIKTELKTYLKKKK